MAHRHTFAVKEDPTPQPPQDPGNDARDWLYRFERVIRDRDFAKAGEMFHANCVYYGLVTNDRDNDWSETWKSWLLFTFDIAQCKVICEGYAFVVAVPWLARGLLHGSEPIVGRMTLGLMQFSNKKLLAVHCHSSRAPQTK